VFVGVVGAEDGSADAAILLWVRASLLHVGLLVVCGGSVEEPERFGEGSAVASSSHDAEPRGFQLLGLVRILPMDFNVG
jgi:hypothetical protein